MPITGTKKKKNSEFLSSLRPSSSMPKPIFYVDSFNGRVAQGAKENADSDVSNPDAEGDTKALVWDGAPDGVWYALRDLKHIENSDSEEDGIELHFEKDSKALMIKTEHIQGNLQRKEFEGNWELDGADLLMTWEGAMPLRLQPASSDAGIMWKDEAGTKLVGSVMPRSLKKKEAKALKVVAAKALAKQITKAGEPTDFIFSGCRKPLESDLQAFERTMDSNGFMLSLGMTLEKCFMHCASQAKKGMKYFGIARGTGCFCSPLPVGDRAVLADCDVQCDGRPSTEHSEMCGGKTGAASVYTMIDCIDPSVDEIAAAEAVEKKQIKESYGVFQDQGCGDAEGNTVALGQPGSASPVLSGTVEECKAACWNPNDKGAEICHGFTYDELKSSCTFVVDVFDGEMVKKLLRQCYWKKTSGGPQ